MRERYAQLMARPDRIEDILQAGAAKARRLSQPLMAALREAVGLRASAVPAQASVASAQKAAGKRARFVRSEERRVGKEWVSTCRSRWSPYHLKKKTIKQTNITQTINNYYN